MKQEIITFSDKSLPDSESITVFSGKYAEVEVVAFKNCNSLSADDFYVSVKRKKSALKKTVSVNSESVEILINKENLGVKVDVEDKTIWLLDEFEDYKILLGSERKVFKPSTVKGV